MRPFSLLLTLSIFMGLAFQASTLSAQFFEPTKEELQMTADAKAPDATAVYLYDEDITDFSAHTRTFYERIKVLSEKGKELATVRMPYEPSTDKVDIQARTIHSDGTIIPFTEKPNDLVDYKTKGYQLDTLVFTLPDVQVGSIIDYRITVKYKDTTGDPTWRIQQPYPIRKAHYVFKGTSGLTGVTYASRIGNDTKVQYDNKGTYILDLTDVPALPQEDWMPPLNTVKWRVNFFYSHYPTQQAYWDDAAKVWADAIKKYVDVTGTLKKAATEIVAPGDTEMQKTQKIYAAVMKIENTDFTREKSKVERKKEKIKDIHNAQDVWRDQLGDSDQIALLFVALARAAGLRVDPMAVVDRSRALFDEYDLRNRQFTDFIAVAHLDGKELWLDPGEKMCPFEMLHWKHSLTNGFRMGEGDKTATISMTPSVNFKSSFVQRVADLTIGESGSMTGLIRVILNGQEAMHWRQIALQNDEDEVRKQFNDWMKESLPDGVQADFDHFLALDRYESNLLGTVRVSGTLGTATGKRFFLPGLFFQSKEKHPFVAQEKRDIPVDVQYPRSAEDEVTYRLPAGYHVESSPMATKFSWPDHAIFNVVSKDDGDKVTVVRNFAYNYTILDPKQYGNLHDFYQKIATADQQQLVLTRTAVAKGN